MTDNWWEKYKTPPEVPVEAPVEAPKVAVGNEAALIKGFFRIPYIFMAFVAVCSVTILAHVGLSRPRVETHTLPADPITNGMSTSEVKARLGEPGQVIADCGEINPQLAGSSCYIYSNGTGWLLIFNTP